MKTIEKWLERLYTEKDLDKNIAVSLSGIVGLLLYLHNNNIVISFFSLIISFPIIRTLSTGIIKTIKLKKHWKTHREQVKNLYKELSDDEKKVVHSFVFAGGCVVTCGYMNRQDVSFPAVESLIQRELLKTSVSADGIRETFVLDLELFAIAKKEMIPF